MPSSITVAAFVFGVALLIAAVIGKDIEIVSVKIPALSGANRIAAGILGVFLIIIGFFNLSERLAPSTSVVSTPTTVAQTGIQATVTPMLMPSSAPTSVPSDVPTVISNSVPTSVPSNVSTTASTSVPSDVPTMTPTVEPNPKPTIEPTAVKEFGLEGDRYIIEGLELRVARIQFDSKITPKRLSIYWTIRNNTGQAVPIEFNKNTVTPRDNDGNVLETIMFNCVSLTDCGGFVGNLWDGDTVELEQVIKIDSANENLKYVVVIVENVERIQEAKWKIPVPGR